MADTNKEPVLVVPSKLTKSAFSALLVDGLVARRWHLEGRHGSRTFPAGRERMGLPLLPWAAERVESFLWGRGDAARGGGSLSEGVRDLLSTEGVDIARAAVPVPQSVPEPPAVNATVHRERAPSTPREGSAGGRISVPSRGVGCASAAADCGAAPAFTFAELFSGVGGFGVALERLGGRCVFASEIEESCRRIYGRNICVPPRGIDGDICDVPSSELPWFDLLVAGFPCQPFSSLGDQPGLADSARGLLYTQIVRVLEARRPKAFLLENVPGLLRTGDALSTIASSLEGAGYSVTFEVCSSRCLTAQSRKRLFFVGLLRDGGAAGGGGGGVPFEFPFIPDLGLRAADVIEFDVEVRMGEGGSDAGNPSPGALHISDAQMDRLLTRSKRWKPAKLAWPDRVCDPLDGHYGVTVGKGNSQLVPCRAPSNPRCFTPRECARLMGFPGSFWLPPGPVEGQGERAYVKSVWKCFGNAVCPPVIAALAGAILLQCPDIAGYRRHSDWRAWGLEVATSLAVDSVLPHRRESIEKRLKGLLCAC